MGREFCSDCDREVEPTEPDKQRAPCPVCGGTTRRLEASAEFGVRLSEHLEIAQLRQGQPIAFAESDRSSFTRYASLEPDGTIVFDLRGLPPRGEEDTKVVCETLVAALRSAGGEAALIGLGTADEDYVVMYRGSRIGVQVVRALTDPRFWARLGQTRNVSRARLTVSQAADALRKAVEHKAGPTGIPASQRPRLILALDAYRLPSLALGPVATAFRNDFSSWARALGFHGVFIVGPGPEFVARLDAE